MNSSTTAKLKLRVDENVSVLTLRILGLVERDGHGQFTLTEKFERLQFAVARKYAGETLLSEEEHLLLECAVLITCYFTH